MAAAICSPSPECDGGKADYTNERVRVFSFAILCWRGRWVGNEEEEEEEGGSLTFKHIILRRSLGAPVSRGELVTKIEPFIVTPFNRLVIVNFFRCDDEPHTTTRRLWRFLKGTRVILLNRGLKLRSIKVHFKPEQLSPYGSR